MDEGWRDFLAELTEPLGGVTMRRMFGGLGIYRDGVIFAISVGDVLFLKADEVTIPDFEAEGCGPFTYTSKDGRTSRMPYWRAPERLFDEPEAFRAWALAAAAAARRLADAKEAAAVAKKAAARPRAARKARGPEPG
ncbi:TfoX/Sxy family protein [Oharaeibacter diazotrophicus]|uniref:DNA transformation protein n=2 Tax=Oharaeibacter diazotrophicus TaxID=1920512 RepID=A0A4R6RMN4_9HYPH|nr:TfoX/Sxy family protein [Oharaeibacter diazotrophicus]TDP87297.1 DNA transformation protein [Oharaeibacter diazotrophicus]BBE70759.1 hypothetical protein OHA_1_00323 [Pleomorphomonas sp. SM30]GLS77507.1 hypothetical protein GCM10007904_28440 [Oharaeibacter diazotrophicus]